jgi:NADP-dependent 3-hydroxy acid dehydrogenase YdfG
MRLFDNKTIFITGASSGIGKACAEEFAKEGANLLLSARREERLNELENTLKKNYSIKVKTLLLDVRDKKRVEKGLSSLPQQWKDIDVLINNAGLARGFDKIQEGSTVDWDEMIDTNIKGLLFVTRQVLPNMIRRECGHIINIGSTAGHEVYVKGNVYCATKFAVKALTQSIRIDVLDKNIKVTSIDPGMVETEFSLVRFNGDSEKAKNVYGGLVPLSAKDVASAVVFCASRPPHVNINEIIITPVAQASSTQVYRK